MYYIIWSWSANINSTVDSYSTNNLRTMYMKIRKVFAVKFKRKVTLNRFCLLFLKYNMISSGGKNKADV